MITNTEDFIKKSNIVHKNKYTYNKTSYINTHTKVTITCPVHGDFEQKPVNHLNSNGCSKCSNKYKRTQEEFINECLIKHQGFYSYGDVVYKNQKSKITITCPVHGDFEQTASDHLSGSGCSECRKIYLSNKFKKSQEKFINECLIKHQGFYSYLHTNYDNSYSKITITCPVHGDFEQVAKDHLSGSGCSECAQIKLNRQYINQGSNTQEFIQKAKITHKNKYNYDKVEYKSSQEKVCITCPKHGDWDTRPDNHINAGSGCPKCSNNISKPEQDIADFIRDNYKGTVIQNDRVVLNGKELDIYLPDLGFAIEYNGLMWHSFGKHKSEKFDNYSLVHGNKNNHLIKTKECEKKGIQLFHIFENEYTQKQDIWLNIIKDKLQKNQKIGARKTTIKEITPKEQRDFENNNHLQGQGLSSIRIGLFYEQELVSLMTFGKARLSKKYQYEMIRFCSKIGYTIQGAASKILNYFEKKYNPLSIVSYANRRYSVGNLYNQLGFKLEHTSKPNFFYFDREYILYSRQKFQKHKLKKELEFFDNNKTALMNMFDNDYRVIYDSGNMVFVKEYS